MSFPKISRTIDKDQERIEVKFLTDTLELILNRDKCVGCGTCARVCPKDAISRGPVGASRRFPTTEDIIPEIYDPEKCVFCGTCVYMCPFSALILNINGETTELEQIQLVKEKVMPKLDFEAKKIKNNEGIERIVKQYAEAEISIVDEECAGGCASCAEVCPSGAIIVPPKSDKGWESSKNVEVKDQDLCVACGACDNACPTGAIKLKIIKVNHSGEFKELYWNDLLKRLRTLRWSEEEKKIA
jgi:4Fe-4S ferredoxin